MHQFVPLINADPVLEIVSRISLFGGTSDRQLQKLLGRLECGTVRKGEAVFTKGDEPFYIYLLKSGKLSLLLDVRNEGFELHELRIGDCFGEASLMSMHRHTATVVAKEDSEIIALSRRALIDLRHEDIELFALLMMNISRELARRLYLADGMLLQYLNVHEKDEGVEKTFLSER